MKRSPQQREHARQRAINCFVQGAAALSHWPAPQPQHVAHALLQAALAMHLIAQLDDEGEALVKATEWLKAQGTEGTDRSVKETP